MKLFIFIICVLCICGLAYASVVDIPYLQKDRTSFRFQDLPVLADWGTIPVDSTNSIGQMQIERESKTGDNFYMLLNNQLLLVQPKTNTYIRLDEKLHVNITKGCKVVPDIDISMFYLITPSSTYKCSSDSCVSSVQFSLGSSVNDAVYVNALPKNIPSDFPIKKAPGLLVGSKNGLYYYSITDKSYSIVRSDQEYFRVAYSAQAAAMVASTQDKLYRYDRNQKPIDNHWRYYWTPGIIDDKPTGLAFDQNDTLWIVNNVCINTQTSIDLIFTRIGGHEGLPVANLTTVEVSEDGSVWIGSVYGAIRYFNGAFEYMFGPKWLPTNVFNIGNIVSDITIISSHATSTGLIETQVVIAVDTGYTIMSYTSMTLAEKADIMNTYVYPRHDRYNLVSPCTLSSWGSLNNTIKMDNDNDGLWTAMYLISQAFRYGATGSEEARINAWKAFEGLEFLVNITGVKGLMARSALKQETLPSDDWVRSTVYPGWVWKHDTSSDEVVGHLAAYPVVYKLLSRNDMERQRCGTLLRDITDYIVQNNFYLLDYNNKPTTWGKWNPTYINDNPDWYDQRGLNSMMILGWLTSDYEIFKESHILDAFLNLTEIHSYDENLVNAKITQPDDNNYSDDELLYMSYFPKIFTQSQLIDNSYWKYSVGRTFSIVKHLKSALWNIMSDVSGAVSDAQLNDAMWCLRTLPISMIDWPFQNSHRLDIALDFEPARGHLPQMVDILRYDEGGLLRWNTSPLVMDGGSGMSENEPTVFLLPYWMGRYYNVITTK